MPDKEAKLGGTQFEFRAVTAFPSSGSEASDAISSIDFSPDGSHFATGGLAKKLRFYALKPTEEGVNADLSSVGSSGSSGGPVVEKVEEIYAPAKLSSVAWCPSDEAVITCGDYDGVVTDWNIECGVPVVERYDHGGQRAWSVDYSRAEHQAGLSASASADGTVRLWNVRTDRNVGIIRPSLAPVSVCSVQFSPFDPSLIAAASADGSFSLFDIRKADKCLRGKKGHARAVSYVRFGADKTLVSASIDNTVKVWDMAEFGLLRKWEGQHLNVKNFVGLSVLERSHGDGGLNGGFIACGSETNQVFVYQRDDERPIWRSSTLPSANHEGGAFVGAVCWRRVEGGGSFGDVHCLVAANSDGSLHLIHARVRRLPC